MCSQQSQVLLRKLATVNQEHPPFMYIMVHSNSIKFRRSEFPASHSAVVRDVELFQGFTKNLCKQQQPTCAIVGEERS